MISNSKKKIALVIQLGALCLAVFFLSSCGKAGIGNTQPVARAAVNFVQASPDEPGIALFFYNTSLNTSTITYGQSTGYILVNAGIDTVRVSNASTAKTILSEPLIFAVNNGYSLFLANTPANPEYFVLTDTLTAPATGNAGIRFVNVSPDAPAVDLVIKGGATLVSNRAYKGFSSFLPIQGNAIYTLEVHQAGTGTVLATLATSKLQAGTLYTVWFHGLAANTSSADQLAVDMMTNGYFSL